jgi:hypothetical protein
MMGWAESGSEIICPPEYGGHGRERVRRGKDNVQGVKQCLKPNVHEGFGVV